MRTDDVRALLRLAGEVGELSSTGAAATLHALRGLSALTRSVVALEFVGRVAVGRHSAIERVTEHGWPAESDRQRVCGYAAGLLPEEDPLVFEALKRRGPVASVARAEVVAAREWNRSFQLNEVYAPSRLADSLISLVRPADSWRSRVYVFKRAAGDGAFGKRERDLLHLFLSESLPFFSRPEHIVPDVKLSRREREVLGLLLTGAPEKHIADRLGVARSTTHQYVTSLYRKLSMTSRAELMADAATLRALAQPHRNA